MSCEILSISGNQHSKLAETLSKINDNNSMITKSQMNYFRSKSFLEEFGNYIEAFNKDYKGEQYKTILERVDDNGEPLLILDEENEKYYFTNKENQKVYFPIESDKLRNILKYEDIEKVTSRLANSYFNLSGNSFNNIDFESGEKLPDLNSFIKKELEDRMKLAEDEEDYVKFTTVEELLNHVDELTDEVTGFFKRMSLIVKEDPDYDAIADDETTKDDPGFGISSFQRDSKSNISKNIKLRLSLLENKAVKDPIFNEPTFYKFSEVYSTLATILTDQVALQGEDIFDIYKENINRLETTKPFLVDISSHISNFNENEKNEFVQAFNLNKNNFQISNKTTVDGVINYNVMGISDSGNKTSTVINNWFNNFKSSFLNSDNDLKKDSLDKIKEIEKQLDSIHKEYSDVKKSENYIKDEEVFLNKFLPVLSKLGIVITPEGLDTFLQDYNKDISLTHRKKKLEELTYRMFKASESIHSQLSKLKDKEIVNDSIFSKKTSYLFNQISKAEAFHIEDGTDATIRFGNKQQWIYSYPSYLSTLVKSWKKDPYLLRILLNSSEFNKGSFLLKYLIGDIDFERNTLTLSDDEKLSLSRDRLKDFDLSIFGQMMVEDEFKPTIELSFNDYFQDNVNKVLLNDFVRTITPAEKGTDYQIKTGLRVDAFNGYKELGTNKFVRLLSKSVVNQFTIDYFGSEYNRMIEAHNEVNDKESKDLTIHYHYKKGQDTKSLTGNAFKSQLFTKLSPGTDLRNLSEQEKELHKLLYLDKKPILKGINDNTNSEVLDKLKSYIEIELINNINKTSKSLELNGVLEVDENRLMKIVNLDQSIIDKYTNEYSDMSLFTPNSAALALTSDYYINSVMQAVEYTKLFSGDMAYYKDPVDFKKRIPATYTDGMQLRVKPGQEDFTVAVVESIMRVSPFIKELRDFLGVGASPYEDINSADAQAWITPQRWKFLNIGLGKWSTGKDSYESVYEKMMSDTPVEYSEKELKIAAQPLKGVYFYRDQKGTPIYLKYSQAVLSKALVKGSDLESLYDKMNKQGIDETITLDGIKVGSIVPTRIHNEDGQLISKDNTYTNKEGIVLDDFELNPIILNNKGWKLQQNLPTKTYKDTDVGSQIQKNIFQGLINNLDDNNFFLNGKFTTGQHVVDKIVNTVTEMSNEGLENLKKEFGINDKGEITNIRGFYNALIKDLEQREGSQNVINALKSEIALPGIPQAGSKLINIFASIVKDRVVKIKTNGGSFIQMSNFGLNKQQANLRGVKWSPNADNTTRPPIRYVDENGKDRVKPGSVLISGSFIAKYIPDWATKSSEELFGTYENGVLIQEGLISPEILNNIIGYRIPNQGLASNDALEIAGILPEDQGDVIVAYTEITTKTGSDFDVDKMYIMFPKFNLVDNKLVYNKEDKSNKLIELYKSVLTNPEVYKDVMRPIDSLLFSDAINSANKAKTEENLDHFDPIQDMKLRYLFLDGKAGVGMLANAIVDIARMGHLTLNNKYLGWGNNENNTTVFDKQFSEKLNKSDLDYYMVELEKFYKENKKSVNVKDYRDSIEKVKIGDSLTYVLNGFVDIAKDPFITKGNWGTSTTNVGTLLLRAGVHPLKVIHFMSQPIISRFVTFQKNMEGLDQNEQGNVKELFKVSMVKDALFLISPEYKALYEKYYRQVNNDLVKESLSKELESGAITQNVYNEHLKSTEGSKLRSFKELIKHYKGDEKAANDVMKIFEVEHNKVFKIETIDVTKTSLQYLREQITDKENPEFQLNILNEFINLQQTSKVIRENVILSKLDTEAGGKNINGFFRILNLKNIIESKEHLEGALVGIASKFKNTTLEAFYNNIKSIINVISQNPKLFPQASFKIQDIFNEISYDLYGQPLINSDLGDHLEVSYNTFLMSQFKPFNLSQLEQDDLINNLPNTFSEFKKKYPENFLLKELQVKQPSVFGKKATIVLNNKQKDATYEKQMLDSWNDLLRIEPEFADKLVKYSFVTTGFKMSADQFFTFVPSQYYVNNDINRFINDFAEVDQSSFLDLFYRNNLTNKKYVRKLSYNAKFKSLYSNINEGLILEGDINKADYYFDKQVKTGKKDKNNKDIYDSYYYRLEGYLPVIQDGEVIRKRPLYFEINPAFNKINGKKVDNYNTDNLENLYKYPNDVKSTLDSIKKINENPEYNGLYVLESRNNTKENSIESSQEIVKQQLEPEVISEEETKQEVKSEVSNMIYSELGNKTKSENVVIKSWGELKDATKAITSEGIISTRIKNINEHFGNPFSHDPAGKTQGLIKTETVKEAVEKFTDWVINSKDERANWIREQLKSGQLKGKLILYYKELGEPSHATALDYLINKYNWKTNEFISNKPQQLSLFDQPKTITKQDLLKSLFKKDTTSNIVKGSVVDYNSKKWIVWNISDTNKAQLIDTEGNKFSGTPMLDKLTKIGDYTTTEFNGTDYIVTANENIYSLDTGKQVFTNLDGSTKSKKEKIINQIMKENDLVEINVIPTFKTMSILKDMFNQNLMINRFNELNINNIEDLENSSENQLGELLKKICK